MEDREVIVGIDGGTKTGICVIDLESGEVEEQYTVVLDTQTLGHRLNHFAQTLEDIEDEYPNIVAAGIEMPHHRGRAATEYAYAYLALTELACWPFTPLHRVHTATVKKYATGHGQASKEEVMKTAEEVTGVTFEDDNAADAYWVACIARNRHRGEKG